MSLVRGLVLNLNAYGATVRLETGELASAPIIDVDLHRAAYDRALTGKKSLSFELRPGRRPSVTLAPQIRDDDLEERIAGFLRESEDRRYLKTKPAGRRRPQ